MPSTERQHRAGVVLVTAAVVAWSTAPFFTRLLHLDSWTILFWRGLFGGGSIALLVIFTEGFAGAVLQVGMGLTRFTLGSHLTSVASETLNALINL
jgi:EamA domain-containing membrane protein RarD